MSKRKVVSRAKQRAIVKKIAAAREEANRVKCGNCYYFVTSVVGDSLGDCRANAPVFSHGEMFGKWPVVHATNWCGLFVRNGSDV